MADKKMPVKDETMKKPAPKGVKKMTAGAGSGTGRLQKIGKAK